MVLKGLGGWETLDIERQYAHLSTSHLAEYANNVCGPASDPTSYLHHSAALS